MSSILFYSTNWSKLSIFFWRGGPFFSLAERPAALGLKLWRSEEIRWSSTDHGLQLDSIVQLVGGDKHRWWITEVLSTVHGKIMQKNHRKNMEQSWVFNQSGYYCATLTRELYFHTNLRDGRCAFENHWKGIPYPEVVLKASRNEGFKVPVLWYHPIFTTERNGTQTL